MLPACYSWLCNDLAKLLDPSRWHTSSRLHTHWIFRPSRQSHHLDRHGERCRRDEEKLHSGSNIRCVLRGQCMFSISGLSTSIIYLTIHQIIGPQLIKTPTLKRHYPELWLGLIIWWVLSSRFGQSVNMADKVQLLHCHSLSGRALPSPACGEQAPRVSPTRRTRTRSIGFPGSDGQAEPLLSICTLRMKKLFHTFSSAISSSRPSLMI